MSPTDLVVFLCNYLEVVFLCVVVTKGAQFDQFDWPRRPCSQDFIYNIIMVPRRKTKKVKENGSVRER